MDEYFEGHNMSDLRVNLISLIWVLGRKVLVGYWRTVLLEYAEYPISPTRINDFSSDIHDRPGD